MRFSLAVLAVMWAGPVMADPVEGVWKTTTGDKGHYGYVEIKPCGGAFCGTLIRGFSANGVEGTSADIGKKIVWDMVAVGDGVYSGGQIWAPDRGKVFAGTMRLSGRKLHVSGCVMGGLICRTQDWTQVK